MEGEAGNTEAFHALHQRALALEPDAPLLLLLYARDIWIVFKDQESSLHEIERLEELLASDRWDRTEDLSLSAYRQKIGTLKAWIRGEPGGRCGPNLGVGRTRVKQCRTLSALCPRSADVGRSASESGGVILLATDESESNCETNRGISKGARGLYRVCAGCPAPIHRALHSTKRVKISPKPWSSC